MLNINQELFLMTQTQNNLIEDNMKFAYWRAYEWAKKQKNIEIEDLISIALLALTKAAATYDPTKNSKFTSYASFVINNEITTELRKSVNYKAFSDNLKEAESEDEVSMTHDSIDDGMDLKEAIGLIPAQSRDMLLDFYQEGLSQYEIADKYGVSQTTVSIIIKKAKKVIASYINQD
jgi:RNA polymerase sigma factor (sigma-70 family)